ncbi:helix-turn-helix domain-containing protein [Azospira sp. APE16]|uniref:helix-turn-helix domain-containing protein n=1 Tax=Azospira sp. APE16 TaxID=3394231 RepID=UPI003A4E4D43
MATNCNKNTSQDWHPADIKAALHKAGKTLKSIAADYGLTSSSTLSAALVRSYPVNEKRIAKALGMHPMEIWPSRYNEDGTRKPQGFQVLQQKKCTRAVTGRNGNARKAA